MKGVEEMTQNASMQRNIQTKKHTRTPRKIEREEAGEKDLAREIYIKR